MRFLSLGLLLTSVQAILIPGPSGPFAVSLTVKAFVDESRDDPYAPIKNATHQRPKRRILTSFFSPIDTSKDACQKEVVPYMPPVTAAAYGQVAESLGLPDTLFQGYELEFCNSNKTRTSKCKTEARFPVLIFSPGYGGSRLLYSAQVRDLASQGFLVITVDHPYDADFVEFPDGTIITGAPSNDTDDATLEQLEVI